MKLTLTTKEGEVVEQWDLDDYDLSKPFARQFLMTEIAGEISKLEERENKGCPKRS
jgi:hypothetical protein